MRINNLSALIIFSTALLLGPLTTAQAQRPGLYVGGEVGAYKTQGSNFSDNDHVLKAYAGGQFTNWFGVEGSWIDFNRIDNGGDNFEADGVGVAAVFSLPMGSLSELFVKGGQFWWKSDSVLGGTLGASDGNDPFWGVGVKVGLNDHLALRLEIERYDVADIHLNTLIGGIEIKF